MEMLERVARAINELAYAEHEAEWAKEKWPVFLPHARAVIEAMREPTEAMWLARPLDCPDREMWAKWWGWQIEAALQP